MTNLSSTSPAESTTSLAGDEEVPDLDTTPPIHGFGKIVDGCWVLDGCLMTKKGEMSKMIEDLENECLETEVYLMCTAEKKKEESRKRKQKEQQENTGEKKKEESSKRKQKEQQEKNKKRIRVGGRLKRLSCAAEGEEQKEEEEEAILEVDQLKMVQHKSGASENGNYF